MNTKNFLLTTTIIVSALLLNSGPAYSKTLAEKQAGVSSAIDRSTKFTDPTLRAILKDIAKGVVANPSLQARTVSGTILGQNVTVDSATDFKNIPLLKKLTGSISGHNVEVTTSAVNFARSSTTDTLVVTVDGKIVYSGRIKDIKQSDLLNAWNNLGQTNANQITSRETARAASKAIVSGISQRIGFSLAPRARKKDTGQVMLDGNLVGISSGDASQKIAVWSNFSYTFLSNTQELSKYDGHLVTGLLGSDYLVENAGGIGGDILLGLAVSREGLGLDTKFNTGILGTDGTSLVPYFGYRLFDGAVVFDALYAHTWLDSSASRNREVGEVTGNYGGSRNAWAANLNYHHIMDNWVISPGVGMVYAHELQSNFNDSVGADQASTETYVGDLKAGGRITYAPTSDIEIYTSHYYSYDMIPYFAPRLLSCATPLGGCSTIRGEVQSSVGTNFYKDNFSGFGDLTVTGELGHTFRENTPSSMVNASARLAF